MVTRRVTRDMNTGDVVQGIYVEHSDFKQYPGFLHTLLPKDIWYMSKDNIVAHPYKSSARPRRIIGYT